MVITATTSPPSAQVTAPEVEKREAKPAPENQREAVPPPRAKSAPAPKKAPTPEIPAQYRLVYDKELSRTFVQVVNRESGEEILRFPPEELVRFIDNIIDRNQTGSAAGLLVDRSV